MTFANPIPPVALAAVLAAVAAVAWLAYRRALISTRRRRALAVLRFTTLVWIVLCLMRPLGRPMRNGPRDEIVPILIDASRSMGLPDAGGSRRIDRARELIDREIAPRLSPRFQADVLRFGDHVADARTPALSATDRRTALGSALETLRERYRGRALAGIVLVSDGGDNGGTDPAASAASIGVPVFAVGVGSRSVERDREVLSVTAADSALSDAVVDVAVSAVSHGYGKAPIDIRLLENGHPLDAHRVTPAADGDPVSDTFHVSPNRDAATVYTVEIPLAAGELVAENNTRSAVVPPAGRARRILLVQGAPGFDHAFLRRAWTTDRGLEVDSVVRKGRDESGADTFYVQAPASRSSALVGGYPNTRDALFAYDAIVLANVDPDQLTNGQLALTRAFVAERGGGLLVLGARGFQHRGFRDTPLEEVIPLDVASRDNAALDAAVFPGRNRAALTPAGEEHPVMQLAPSRDENAKRWAAAPALASISALGRPRAGASVLAVTGGPSGTAALVAVQRLGLGRAMVFTGEASWRWKMQLPSTDQTYDRFWKQAIRWLAQSAPDPVTLTVPATALAGDGVQVAIAARDPDYAPRLDALIDVRVTAPDGRVVAVHADPVPASRGAFRAALHVAEPGVYRVTADARGGRTALGSSTATLLVGGVDPEMTDPRLNEETLERVARASGGAVLQPSELASLVDRLTAAAPAAARHARRELWNTGWSFGVLTVLLSAEWLFRRASGLR